MTDKHVAALIIIGDEILKGQVQDANTMYLAKSLQTIGIKIRRIVVIPDEIDVIAREVSEVSKNYPIVFTSGGVGPTHDDLTYAGVAKGLGLELQENQELLGKLSRLFPDQPESRRLATVPTPCEFVHVASRAENDMHWVVKARNVHVLPGSPRYFRPAVDSILPSLSAGLPLYEDYLVADLDEFELVQILDEQAARSLGSVAIGSYPQEEVNGPRTKITLEGRSREDVERVKKEILAMLPKEKNQWELPSFDEEKARRVRESEKDLEHVRRAFGVLEQCYDRYRSNEVFLSFNGGKDCTVVLHLAATLARLRKLEPPVCLYVTGDAFPEVEEFVQQAASYYGLEMVRKAGSIRQALADLLAERPELKACLLGTRKNDPGAHALEPFAPTDAGWPSVMRVSPIIDWSYGQVWQFLRQHQVPYCSLYDEGYTSLGARDTTTKNPLLRDPQDSSRYLPAHTLADDSAERHGRA